MTNIVATIVGLAEGKHAQEAEAERCRLAYEKARTRYESLITALNEELRLVGKLFRSANRLRRANHLREFIDSCEQKAEEDHTLTSGKQQWIAWARAKADRIAPLIRKYNPILDAPKPAPHLQILLICGLDWRAVESP